MEYLIGAFATAVLGIIGYWAKTQVKAYLGRREQALLSKVDDRIRSTMNAVLARPVEKPVEIPVANSDNNMQNTSNSEAQDEPQEAPFWRNPTKLRQVKEDLENSTFIGHVPEVANLSDMDQWRAVDEALVSLNDPGATGNDMAL